MTSQELQERIAAVLDQARQVLADQPERRQPYAAVVSTIDTLRWEYASSGIERTPPVRRCMGHLQAAAGALNLLGMAMEARSLQVAHSLPHRLDDVLPPLINASGFQVGMAGKHLATWRTGAETEEREVTHAC